MYKKLTIALIASCLLMANTTTAQDKKKEPNEMTLSLGNDGLSIETKKSKSKVFKIEVGVVDLGLNSLMDKSNYNTTAAQTFLQVPTEFQGENLFDLNGGKSWNVNVWPILASWRILKSNSQKIYIGTGVGLQMYNFRFNRPVTYTNEVVPAVHMDSVNTITKNKLGFTYLSVPLMLTFKTKASDKHWLVYGFGVTGGYRVSSWMKQVSNEQGKQKNHNKFNFNDFNSCLTAELGITGYFRLYASYQITPLHEDVLDQHPFSIGLRFGGI